MHRNGVVGFLSLQIEVIVVGPSRPRHHLPITVPLPFSAAIAIKNDVSPPHEIGCTSCGMRRRLGGMCPRSFKGEDFWDGGYSDEEEVGKWDGWRKRRRRNGRDGWKWRRRRRYPEKEASQDAFWLFRVLRPYGWSLPLILLSWLAASGPKAFFFTLAIPSALSAVALLVQFLWPGAEFSSQADDSQRKRTLVGRVGRRGMAGGREDEIRSGKKRDSVYDSWLESDIGLDERSFGGWADLDEERFSDESRLATEKLRKGKIESGKRSMEEAPLLLRLLVAMFPFLASWTKLFW